MGASSVNPELRVEGEPSASSSSQAAFFALAAWALSAVHYATFFDIEKPIYTDNRYFLYFAWRIAEGDIAHLELFDNKTFLANFFGAALYRLADVLSIDPIHFIRGAMLAFASLGGLMTYWIFRRIGGGSAVVGFLGLFALLGFGILGELPAIGNFPKFLMGPFVLASGLAVARGWWFAAGVCGALAFMDWQVGALAGAAAVATALLSEGSRLAGPGLEGGAENIHAGKRREVLSRDHRRVRSGFQAGNLETAPCQSPRRLTRATADLEDPLAR